MGTINHRHVTILPDDPASDISADEWNDALVVRGSDLTGALLARETGAVDGWSAIPAAAGILNCSGAGTLPTWSTSITLTGAITAGSLTTSGAVSAGSLTTTGVVTAGGLLTASGGITTSGPLLFSPDNTYDVGASGATRPRTGYFGTSIAIGTSPATTGAIRLPNESSIYVKSGGGADIQALRFASDDNLYFSAASGKGFVPGSDNAYFLGYSTLRWKDIYAGTSVSIGTNPATTGAIRLANNQGIYARNQANTADLPLVATNTSNYFVLGETGNVTLLKGEVLIDSLGRFNMTQSYVYGAEISAPAGGGFPAATTAFLYFRNNGAGKTQLVVTFNTGGPQVIATQP